MPIVSQLRSIGAYSTLLFCTVCVTACQETQNQSLQERDSAPVVANEAKNVILFIGDGMGVSTVTAGRIFVGQEMGMSGEEHELSFESFDNLALIKTYNTNAQVPDSAGTATAIMSGYKTNIGTVNVEPDSKYQGCGTIPGKPTLAQIAANNEKSVGIISTARITHATPAAMFGYADSRDWEANKDMPANAVELGCRSLSEQLVDPATPINLALGGGAKEFSDNQFDAWNAQGSDHIVIKSQAEFKALSSADKQDVLGLFSSSHLSFEADRNPVAEPSLAELTSFAIDNLSARDDKGFVLMVEAGRIDHAHHGGNAYRALKDFQAFEQAIQTAIDKTSEDTLILVTADHSHVFTIAGYPRRGNPILGLVEKPLSMQEEDGDESPFMLGKDGNPYTTLGYHNGVGEVRTPESDPLTNNMVQDRDYRQQIAIPRDSGETHAGEDVPLYAQGPGAHRVKGVMEQNEIHDVIVMAIRAD